MLPLQTHNSICKLTKTLPISTKILTFLIACIVGVILLWNLLRELLASDKGLDLTDEGLYLLAANPPTETASWGFPFGWHTRPLFQIVNYDIANFRTLGGFLLFVLSGVLGITVINYLQALDKGVSPKNWLAIKIVGSALMGCSSLFYYAGLLRSPSYNWVNLVGILIASIGFTLLLKNFYLEDSKSSKSKIKLLFFSLVFTFGLFYSVPGKPSTTPFMIILTVTCVSILYGFKAGLKWLLGVCFCMAAWLSVALFINLWPTTFISVFSIALANPSLVPAQSIWGSIKNISSIPIAFLGGIISAPPTAFIPWSIGFILIFVSFWIIKNFVLLNVLGASLVALGSLFLIGLPSSFSQAYAPQNRWIYTPFVTAILVFIVALLFVLVLSFIKTSSLTKEFNLKFKIVISIFFVALPFIFGFGSGHGIYPQSYMASVFFILVAMILILLMYTNNLLANSAFGVLTVSTIIAIFLTLYDSHAKPYRIAPIEFAIKETSLRNNQTSLYFDDNLASTIHTLQSNAENFGWEPDTPLVGLAYRWNSTIPYLLEAQVPETLMLTLFGYEPGSTVLAKQNLNLTRLEFPFPEAWILTSRDLTYLDEIIAELEKSTYKSFPEDYTCVIEIGDMRLWKPSPNEDSSSQYSEICQKTQPFISNYDLGRGWLG